MDLTIADNKNKNRLITFVLLVMFFTTISYTQESTSPKFESEDVITKNLKKHLKISLKNNKLSIRQTVEKENYFNTNDDLLFAEERIDYNSFNTIKNLVAYTQHFVKGRKKTSYVEKFFDKDVLIRGVFFNDQKEKKFTYKNIGQYATTKLKYTLQINDPHFIPAYILNSKTYIENAEYSVSYPKEIQINFSVFNLDSTQVEFTESMKDNIKTISWKFINVPKSKRRFDFSPLYYVPQIIIRIESYNSKDEKVNILKDVSDLYSWYVELTENINSTNQDRIKQVTQDLISNITDEREIIETIYYFVQDRINYIAFEDGLNGFVPRDAMNIFDNTYGDCKDMANLLNEMLRYAKIDSYLTWIGTRDRPYTYEKLPTALTDNHMITTVKLNNKYYFLDPTAKYLPFGYPSPFIQGKQALIGLSDENYKLLRVPQINQERNREIYTSTFKLAGQQLTGNHDVKFVGYNKLDFRRKLAHKKEKNLGFLNQSLKYGTKRTSFTDIKISNVETKNDTLSLKFKTETDNYIRTIGDKLYLKLNFDELLKNEIVLDDRINYDKKIDFKYTKQFKTIIQIPDEYVIDHLPEDITISNADYSFYFKYRKIMNKIELQKTIIINKLKIKPKSIDNWNNFVKSYIKQNKKMIVLKPKK